MQIVAISDLHGHLPQLPKADIICIVGDITSDDHHKDGEDLGNKEMTEALKDKDIRYIFCGHIHTGNHAMGEWRGKKIVNVSYCKENKTMKRAIFLVAAIAIQVYFYLSLFRVIEIDLSHSIWTKLAVGLLSAGIGYIVMSIFVKHLRKWMYSIVYTLLLVCAIVLFLCFSGIHLGEYTYIIVIATIYPLSYGAWAYFNSVKKFDSWYFFAEQSKLSDPIKGMKPDVFKPIENVKTLSFEKVYELKEEYKMYSREVLLYVQGKQLIFLSK